MNYKKFEELPCWIKARELCQAIYKLINHPAFKKDFSLRNQIWAASGSAMDNIAEGFERGGNKEFIQFLFISKASGSEYKSQLYRALDKGFINDFEIKELYTLTDDITRMIQGLVNYLRRSDIQGKKFKYPIKK